MQRQKEWDSAEKEERKQTKWREMQTREENETPKRQRESDTALIGLIWVNKDAALINVGVCLCVC